MGWKAGPEQYEPNELLDHAIAADEAGFDSLDVSDHFHPWSDEGQACFTWTWLGAAAGPDTIKQKCCISAHPQDHIDFARRYLDQGFTELYFHTARPDQRAFIEGYARDVLPQLRQSKPSQRNTPQHRQQSRKAS